ncbi:MAG: pilin [Succinivibrionaceae bacterium]
MIVIAIIGILAAIALPAYAKYMARAKFTEVTSAVEGVKKQVELCIFDQGHSATAGGTITVSACKNSNNGTGWRIDASTAYETKYVSSITVSAGTITAKAKSTDNLKSATFVIVPHAGANATSGNDNGVIDWQRDGTSSSCISLDLC